MDKEDKRRYFIVGSVYLEVVTPLFQHKLEENYKGLNFGCLKDFLDDKAAIHILFHLRHRHTKCCTDSVNCTKHRSLPLNHHQWKQLYAENPGPGKQNCFCKYIAKSVKLKHLDVSLCGLILFNCCNLGKLEQEAVNILRRNKNDYLSHNTTCGITKDEYGPLMDELQTNILQLDQTKEDELIRIHNRPLDDALFTKYVTYLLDNHEMLRRDVDLGFITNSSNSTLMRRIGKPIFTRPHQIDLKSVVCNGLSAYVSDIVMMNDVRLVICLPYQCTLQICNDDGSKEDRILINVVNNVSVAVTMHYKSIEIFDIDNKTKIKSILVPGMCWLRGIATINNKLVVGGNYTVQIVDYQTGEVVKRIKTESDPYKLHCTGERIFYCDAYQNSNKKLHFYRYTDESHHTMSFESPPVSVTTLNDGSVYVLLKDGSIDHVPFGGKQYNTVTTNGLQKLKRLVLYKSNQGKLVTLGDSPECLMSSMRKHSFLNISFLNENIVSLVR
ncbi:unnamed protein product [Mytilus edulis]|uniref:DZIP3-like HEPN domain-containing protein n=1 Tax=Mytilus edulis TaxID=6550 RepID=A0A8S3PU74_MYTED|nr:unnamed protein product [Mytilus edulis]